MERIDVYGKLDPDPGQSTRGNSPTREQNDGGMVRENAHHSSRLKLPAARDRASTA